MLCNTVSMFNIKSGILIISSFFKLGTTHLSSIPCLASVTLFTFASSWSVQPRFRWSRWLSSACVYLLCWLTDHVPLAKAIIVKITIPGRAERIMCWFLVTNVALHQLNKLSYLSLALHQTTAATHLRRINGRLSSRMDEIQIAGSTLSRLTTSTTTVLRWIS